MMPLNHICTVEANKSKCSYVPHKSVIQSFTGKYKAPNSKSPPFELRNYGEWQQQLLGLTVRTRPRRMDDMKYSYTSPNRNCIVFSPCRLQPGHGRGDGEQLLPPLRAHPGAQHLQQPLRPGQALQHVRVHMGPRQDVGGLLLGGASAAFDYLQVRRKIRLK